MQTLNKDAIWLVNDLQLELLEIPEWQGSVYVRNMSAGTREEWEESCLRVKGDDVSVNMQNVRVSLAISTVCDSEGQLLFTKADVDNLKKKSGIALDRIFEAARKINRIGNQDVEDLAKNSEETSEGSSPSDSPSS